MFQFDIMDNKNQDNPGNKYWVGLIFSVFVIFAIHVATLEWQDRTLPLYDVKLTQEGNYKVEYSAGRFQNETVSYVLLGSHSVIPSNNSELVLLQGSSAIIPKWKLYYNETYWNENNERKRQFLASIGVFPEE